MTYDAEGVRARLAAATPGPWEAWDYWYDGPLPSVRREGTDGWVDGFIASTAGGGDDDHDRMTADADLIAHAPTDLAAALDEIDALRAAMAASAEEAAPGMLTPREQRIYAAGFEFGLKAAAEGARLAADRGEGT